VVVVGDHIGISLVNACYQAICVDPPFCGYISVPTQLLLLGDTLRVGGGVDRLYIVDGVESS